MAKITVYKVELNNDELDFLLWVLGRAFGESDRLPKPKREYIQRHHGGVWSKLMNADVLWQSCSPLPKLKPIKPKERKHGTR